MLSQRLPSEFVPQRSISTNLKCDSVVISPPLALLSQQCKNTSRSETLNEFIGRGNLEGYTAHLRNNLFAESLELNALCSRMAPFCLIDYFRGSVVSLWRLWASEPVS